MEAGYFAAAIFLVTSGGGSLAQVLKLRSRARMWRAGELQESEICDGLQPVRELWSFTAFSLFALSGLTRSYIDLFLVSSRLPAIFLSTATMWILSIHLRGRATHFLKLALTFDFIFICVAFLAFYGVPLGSSLLARTIDSSLACVSLFLFYGKLKQAKTMFKSQRTQAVSWLRELGLVVKDVSGLWYTLSVGHELIWLSLTHLLSGVSSSLICAAKWRVERRLLQKPLSTGEL